MQILGLVKSLSALANIVSNHNKALPLFGTFTQ